MKRILIDYKKLSHPMLSLLIDAYPYGYGDDDIISFINVQGEVIEAVELRTDDTLYLVKLSKSLANFMANFEETLEKEFFADSSTQNIEDSDLQANRDMSFQEGIEFD
ncbi:MAG: hypothetical protein WBN11_15750 [Eudoraea sp.]|uniref:hypothetical protein n=1 Tax=Eudoraea sp. TaxID=1979955 RepID=UPI003C709E80